MMSPTPLFPEVMAEHNFSNFSWWVYTGYRLLALLPFDLMVWNANYNCLSCFYSRHTDDVAFEAVGFEWKGNRAMHWSFSDIVGLLRAYRQFHSYMWIWSTFNKTYVVGGSFCSCAHVSVVVGSCCHFSKKFDYIAKASKVMPSVSLSARTLPKYANLLTLISPTFLTLDTWKLYTKSYVNAALAVTLQSLICVFRRLTTCVQQI